MTRPRYDEIWHETERLRAFVAQWAGSAPELFPDGFGRGYRLHGFGHLSRKLPGLRLRKIVTAGGVSYWLRPSFIVGYMAGTVDELAYPPLLAEHGVPPWPLTIGFGHSEMDWYRVIERLGRSSLVGTTVRDPARLPGHLVADEPTVPADGCEPGIARPSGLVRVAAARLGVAAQLPAVRAAGQVPSGFRKPYSSAQRRTPP